MTDTIKPASDELVLNCKFDAKSGEPMAWHSGTVLELIARIEADAKAINAKDEALRVIANGSEHNTVISKPDMQAIARAALNHGKEAQ